MQVYSTKDEFTFLSVWGDMTKTVRIELNIIEHRVLVALRRPIVNSKKKLDITQSLQFDNSKNYGSVFHSKRNGNSPI